MLALFDKSHQAQKCPKRCWPKNYPSLFFRIHTGPLPYASPLPSPTVFYSSPYKPHTTPFWVQARMGCYGDRQIRLVHGDYHTVTLKRNLGRSTLKPWCTVIEAEYYDEGFPRSRILLAASYLLDRSFMEGSIQAPWYTGNGLEATVCDRGPAQDLGPQYGVLYAYYERAHEGEEFPEDTTAVDSDGTNEEEGGYWHILADEQDSP
ncbi:hypothetical protein FB451DRAFT_1179378 [Mycena latifolia]|nr:hypothetical protein FB451DRAFT_1179378 [Mycena latifolia]